MGASGGLTSEKSSWLTAFNVNVTVCRQYTVQHLQVAMLLAIRTNCTNKCHDTEPRDGILDEVGLSCADEGGEGAVVFVVVGVGRESGPLSIQDSLV